MPSLNLVLEPVASPGVMAAKLWTCGGSSADPQDQRGAHNLLGSLLSRGCGPFNHLELADLVEGCGAGLRCDTHEDGTLISLKCLEEDADQLLPLIGWMLIDPHLDPDQINLEKDLCLQALQRQREDPFHLAFDGWRQLAYGQGPYGHDPLGLSNELSRIDREQLKPLANNLAASMPILALAGSLPDTLEQKLLDMEPFQALTAAAAAATAAAAARTSSPTTASGTSSPLQSRPLPENPSTLSLTPEPTNQVVIMIGQPTLEHGHDDDLALRLLQCHLGQGMSSLLFRRLREEHGVAYDVGVHHPARRAAAPFVFHASTSEDRAQLSLSLLLESWWEMSSGTLSAEDMALAKAKFRGHLAHSCQTTGQRAERRAQLRGLGLPDDQDLRNLEAIEAMGSDDLQQAARRHLQSPLLSLCGPEKTLTELGRSWQARPAQPS